AEACPAASDFFGKFTRLTPSHFLSMPRLFVVHQRGCTGAFARVRRIAAYPTMPIVALLVARRPASLLPIVANQGLLFILIGRSFAIPINFQLLFQFAILFFKLADFRF